MSAKHYIYKLLAVASIMLCATFSITANAQALPITPKDKWYVVNNIQDLQVAKHVKNLEISFNAHLNLEDVLNHLDAIPDASLSKLALTGVGVETELDAISYKKIIEKVKNENSTRIAITLGRRIVFKNPQQSAWKKLFKSQQIVVLIMQSDPSVYYTIGKNNMAGTSAYIDSPAQAQAFGRGLVASKISQPREIIISGNASNLSVFASELQHKKDYFPSLFLVYDFQTMPVAAEAKALANTVNYVKELALEFFTNPSPLVIASLANGINNQAKYIANFLQIYLPPGIEPNDFSPIYDAYAKANANIRAKKIFVINGRTFRATDPGIKQNLFEYAIYQTDALDPAWIDVLRGQKIMAINVSGKKLKDSLKTAVHSDLPYAIIQTGAGKTILVTNNEKIIQWYANYVNMQPSKIKEYSGDDLKLALHTLKEDQVLHVPENQLDVDAIQNINTPFLAVHSGNQGGVWMRNLPLSLPSQSIK